MGITSYRPWNKLLKNRGHTASNSNDAGWLEKGDHLDDGTHSSDEHVAGLHRREFIALMALISMMSALAIDMLLPAFSEMRPAFGLEPDANDLSMAITLFFMGSAVGSLVMGPLTDALGRKTVLFGSLALYGLASAVVTIAPSLTVLLVARFIWGVGASGPRVLSQAIVRDRFSGTAMAHIMALIQAVFFLAPIMAPLTGSMLLNIGNWRLVTISGAFIAAFTITWALRLEETLPPENRQQLNVVAVIKSYLTVMKSPVVVAFTLGLSFGFSAFMSFLGSIEFVFTSIYDRHSLFIWYFIGIGTLFSFTALGVNKLLSYVSARPLSLIMAGFYLVGAWALFAVISTNDGLPPLAVFLVFYTIAIMGQIVTGPIASSLALEPMGDRAGTASAAIGAVSTLIGAFFANQIDKRLTDDVWPIGAGYAIFISLAFCCYLAAFFLTRSTTETA